MRTNALYSSRSGFTLVELIVTATVLALLTIFLAQFVNNAAIVTNHSRKHIDADSQARLLFDRMAADFSGILRRNDVDYLFAKQTGNDKMFFYSEAPAFFDGDATQFQPRSSVALLGYRVNANSQVERLGKLLTWTGSASTQPGSVVFLTYPPATPATPKPTPIPQSLLENNWPTTVGSNPDYNGSDSDYHVLAEQALRLEFCFLLKSGKYVFDPAASGATSIHDLSTVSAVVVGLVVLDTDSQKIADTQKLSAAFADPTDADLTANPPVLMGAKWRQQLYSGEIVQTTGIPKAAAAQIRIYERHFPLQP